MFFTVSYMLLYVFMIFYMCVSKVTQLQPIPQKRQRIIWNRLYQLGSNIGCNFSIPSSRNLFLMISLFVLEERLRLKFISASEDLKRCNEDTWDFS